MGLFASLLEHYSERVHLLLTTTTNQVNTNNFLASFFAILFATHLALAITSIDFLTHVSSFSYRLPSLICFLIALSITLISFVG